MNFIYILLGVLLLAALREFYLMIRFFRYDGIRVKVSFWSSIGRESANIIIYSFTILNVNNDEDGWILIWLYSQFIVLSILGIFSKGSKIIINEEGIIYQGKIYPFEKMEYCYIDKTNKLKFKGKNYKDIIKTTSTIEFDINEEDKYEINSLIRGGVRSTNESI
ncbi:hypothetical protein [Clostridium peptidivorans]|uniref:hypothetical protein n=1 Tax=Clostridium peptidivorans TaxID=100174 RepID=UPI000BE28B3E|nr:hypothetical protein [Clostridium peptidivorans]